MKKFRFFIIRGVIYPRGKKPIDCPLPKIMATTYEIPRTLEEVKREGYPLCWEKCLKELCSARDIIKKQTGK